MTDKDHDATQWLNLHSTELRLCELQAMCNSQHIEIAEMKGDHNVALGQLRYMNKVVQVMLHALEISQGHAPCPLYAEAIAAGRSAIVG
jgi:hypothetical protein|tara:strand:- start:300 stop:566 length:267 start_codon:yes stop_codon:yes gene_type:complete